MTTGFSSWHAPSPSRAGGFFRQLSGCKLFDGSTCFAWVSVLLSPYSCKESIGLLFVALMSLLWRAMFVAGRCMFCCWSSYLAHFQELLQMEFDRVPSCRYYYCTLPLVVIQCFSQFKYLMEMVHVGLGLACISSLVVRDKLWSKKSPDCLGNLEMTPPDCLGNLEMTFPDCLGNLEISPDCLGNLGFPDCLDSQIA